MITKKFSFLAILFGLLFMTLGCTSEKVDVCHIVGTVTEPQLNGVQIFLVPMKNDTRFNVDSVYIKDGHFEFSADTVMLAKIVVDYHFRSLTQMLLVAVEPGEVNVTIGKTSSAMGTPLNDSLQHWKVATEEHNRELGQLRRTARETADKAQKETLLQSADSVHLAYKQYTRQMAQRLPESELRTFLEEMFPRKYKARKPDSTIVWVDADTHEELGPVEK